MSTRSSAGRRMPRTTNSTGTPDDGQTVADARNNRLTTARGIALAAIVGVLLWAVLIWLAVQVFQRVL